MRSHRFSKDFPDLLARWLAETRTVLGPVTAADGITRLQPIDRYPTGPALPLLSVKKTLIPPRERLWAWAGSEVLSSPPAPELAVAGLFPCDLYAVAFLDRVFSQDEPYCRRRGGLFLLGRACIPNEDCFCPPRPEPPPFDLYLGEDRVWAGSVAGEGVLDGLAEVLEAREETDLPLEHLAGRAEILPGDLEERFHHVDPELWQTTGSRCLSCGACSAVCPTCYCFSMLDSAALDNQFIRRRDWDNCFFRDHALVAGGHNFRPHRAERLRFRFEHKYLGLGALRGVSSCVGCGRCRRTCPVDIDLAEVLAMVADGGRR